ncbi:hypothetical protein E4U39_002670 [Claviceps sp. Clav50 group G5]|nr:hypothetical protein E4U39_002670 [Claviceps sp. Clav50 group G5]
MTSSVVMPAMPCQTFADQRHNDHSGNPEFFSKWALQIAYVKLQLDQRGPPAKKVGGRESGLTTEIQRKQVRGVLQSETRPQTSQPRYTHIVTVRHLTRLLQHITHFSLKS